jgi:hypothetical protein
MVHSFIVGCEQSIQSSRDPSIAIGRTGIAQLTDKRQMPVIVLFVVSRASPFLATMKTIQQIGARYLQHFRTDNLITGFNRGHATVFHQLLPTE